MTGKVVSLTGFKSGVTKTPRSYIKGNTLMSEKEGYTGHDVKDGNRRRDITLSEQRLYSRLDAITEKLESVIRLEEKQAHVEDRLSEHGDHIATIVRDQNRDRISIARLEGLRDEMDIIIEQVKLLRRKHADMEVNQTGTKTVISFSSKLLGFIFAILLALGLWGAKDNTVDTLSSARQDQKSKQQTNGNK